MEPTKPEGDSFGRSGRTFPRRRSSLSQIEENRRYFDAGGAGNTFADGDNLGNEANKLAEGVSLQDNDKNIDGDVIASGSEAQESAGAASFPSPDPFPAASASGKPENSTNEEDDSGLLHAGGTDTDQGGGGQTSDDCEGSNGEALGKSCDAAGNNGNSSSNSNAADAAAPGSRSSEKGKTTMTRRTALAIKKPSVRMMSVRRVSLGNDTEETRRAASLAYDDWHKGSGNNQERSIANDADDDAHEDNNSGGGSNNNDNEANDNIVDAGPGGGSNERSHGREEEYKKIRSLDSNHLRDTAKAQRKNSDTSRKRNVSAEAAEIYRRNSHKESIKAMRLQEVYKKNQQAPTYNANAKGRWLNAIRTVLRGVSAVNAFLPPEYRRKKEEIKKIVSFPWGWFARYDRVAGK